MIQDNHIRRLLLLLITAFCSVIAHSQVINWPDSIYSGKQGHLHVQGVAVDEKKGFIYFSFTDKLIKTDLSGKLIGSVTGFVGHLGDLDFNDEDGKIYGSLEYKNDEIGKGIRKKLGMSGGNKETGFYVAVFDGDRIVRPGMNAGKEKLLHAVYLSEVTKDYEDSVLTDNTKRPHRYACSGIDGLAFAPSAGNSNTRKKYLYIAYGIYGDTTRSDNDCQIILKYDVSNWGRYNVPLIQQHLQKLGPWKPEAKYFVRTGNTQYGIQNLAYDPYTGNLFAAVYHGIKSRFPNYDLFVIDMHKKPVKRKIWLYAYQQEVDMLSLSQDGLKRDSSGIRGWYFKWGATGLCPLGKGLFYISHNKKASDDEQSSTLYLYKWTGDKKSPFSGVQ